jgi:hypothetical protein
VLTRKLGTLQSMLQLRNMLAILLSAALLEKVRSACGDLTSAFDFTGSNSQTHSLQVSSTDDFRQRIARSLAGAANAIPAIQAATTQLPEASLVAYPADDAIELILNKGAAAPCNFTIKIDDRYPTKEPRTRNILVAPGRKTNHRVRLGPSDNWYDLTVTVDNDTAFLRRFAGKVDNGRPGRTDPRIGTMQLTV